MATAVDSTNVEEFIPTVVVLLKNVVDYMVESEEADIGGDSGASASVPVSHVTRVHDTLVDMNTIITFVLHDF
jgi:hypothetical protein